MSTPLLPVRVWDLPTRLFHWTLASCVVGSVVSGRMGSTASAWHFRFGYVVFALLLFRLVWGFLGGHWSRFKSFTYTPGAVLRYMRGHGAAGEHDDVGHSPLGALSVWALLLILSMEVGSGLVSKDELGDAGPLVRLVSDSLGAMLGSWHKSWGQWLLIALVAMHVAAIAFYAFGRQTNLVRAMLIGDKRLPAGVPVSRDSARTRLFALVVIAACAAAVAWTVSQQD